MKNLYLILAVIGFIAPNILVVIESVETGNIMLYADIESTFSKLFANRISSIFAIDLLITVAVFFVWSYIDGKKHQVKYVGWIWLSTMLLGLSGGLPLYLWAREKALSGAHG